MQQVKQQVSKFNFRVEDSRNTPEKKFMSGAISATVWHNQAPGKDGVVNFRTVSFQKAYKDKSGKWQNSGNLRINDLPKASLVLQKAYEYLVMRESLNSQDEEPVEEII